MRQLTDTSHPRKHFPYYAALGIMSAMIIRCPKCKFVGVISDTNRLTVDQPISCPRCETLILYPDDPNGTDSCVQAPAGDRQPQGIQWEQRVSWLDIGAFWRTSKDILFHPSDTFAKIYYDEGIGSSLIYLLVYGSLGQIIGRYWFTLLGIHYGILEGNPISNSIRFAGMALMTPFLLLAFIFVAAGLVHLVLRILLAAHRPFSSTLKVMAYASAASSLVNVIPFLGRVMMPVWALILYSIGLRQVHRTSGAKVFCALFLPVVILGLIAIGVATAMAVLYVLKFFASLRLHL
jgi:hypothetical protein